MRSPHLAPSFLPRTLNRPDHQEGDREDTVEIEEAGEEVVEGIFTNLRSYFSPNGKLQQKMTQESIEILQTEDDEEASIEASTGEGVVDAGVSQLPIFTTKNQCKNLRISDVQDTPTRPSKVDTEEEEIKVDNEI